MAFALSVAMGSNSARLDEGEQHAVDVDPAGRDLGAGLDRHAGEPDVGRARYVLVEDGAADVAVVLTPPSASSTSSASTTSPLSNSPTAATCRRSSAAALRRHLGIADDDRYCHVFDFGSQKPRRYSDNALRELTQALDGGIDMDEVWRQHALRFGGGDALQLAQDGYRRVWNAALPPTTIVA